MNAKYVTSKEAVLNWICTKYSASEEASIASGSTIIIGMNKPIKYETKEEVEALPYYQQETWKANIKRYSERIEQVNKKNCARYSVLLGQMSHSLRTKVKSEPNFKEVSLKRDTLKLFLVIEKVCNLTSSIGHYCTRMVEGTYIVVSSPYLEQDVIISVF